MSLYRRRLPQLQPHAGMFLSEGGLETTLIYDEGLDLPHFASFDLLKDAAGTEVLRRYYRRFAAMAVAQGVGAVFETPTWRANAEWGARLGYDAVSLAQANRLAVSLLLELRHEFAAHRLPLVISGNLGPRGDGYVPGRLMSAGEARRYHGMQVATFASTDADLVSVFTMNYVEEAIGIALAARECAMPLVVSFTLETDGRLPSGQPLADAIAETDAASSGHVAYYMINCAHPSHFDGVIAEGGAWTRRVRGLRANASRRSHAELDAATELDAGDPQALGGEYRRLRARLPGLCVVGGCCGTDHRHVEAICRALGSELPEPA